MKNIRLNNQYYFGCKCKEYIYFLSMIINKKSSKLEIETAIPCGATLHSIHLLAKYMKVKI